MRNGTQTKACAGGAGGGTAGLQPPGAAGPGRGPRGAGSVQIRYNHASRKAGESPTERVKQHGSEAVPNLSHRFFRAKNWI